MTFALITGASQGIGKAIALGLARRKYNLIVVARNEKALQELTSEITAKYGVKADYLVLDLSVSNASKVLFDWCSEKKYDISILVNNAGYGLCGLFAQSDMAENNRMLQLNLVTLVEICHVFLPVLQKKSQAYILNVCSTSAYQALPFMNLYAASKAFVLRFSLALRYELRKTVVSVTCLCPGATDTLFTLRANITGKALETAQKVSMSAEAVAEIGIKAMFARKTEVIPGFLNRLGAFFAWLLPAALVERIAANIYE